MIPRHLTLAVTAALLTAVPLEAAAALAGAPQIGGIIKRGQQLRELQVSDEEEIRLGEAVSEKVRDRYGVVQDKAVHRYVTLVGTLLAQKSSRPSLRYTFIVLDTDGVNAFAAPGGFVHITRGALGLLKTESELAGVLAHEIAHVAERHTVKAIQKGRMVQMGAEETLSNPALFSRLVDKAAELVLAGFGRAEELESDQDGLALANATGYAPGGLGSFLARLSQRNASSTEKQGLFASHPEMKERLSKLDRQIADRKLTASAVLGDRYAGSIPYTAKPLAEIVAVEPGTAGLTGGGAKPAESGSKDGNTKAEPKKRGFGLGNMMRPGGEDKKTAEVTGSGASRGVDTERNARGGPVKTLVAVTVTPAELEAFRQQGKLGTLQP